MSKRLRIIALALVLVFYCTLTYGARWISVAGSALIILLARCVWSKNGIQVIGLKIPRHQIDISLFLFGVVLICSFQIINVITMREGVIFVPVYENQEWLSLLVHTIGQTLNEEMVLGALFLRAIQNRFKSTHPFVTSIGVTLTFSLLHYAFYGLRPPEWVNYGILSATTLISLFAMGVARNNCILSTENIGYAWALHLGWNVAFIDGSFYSSASHTKLAEPSMFNLILGDRYLVVVAVVLMALSFLLFVKGSSKREFTDGEHIAST
jgi:hypothetical protein